MIPTAELPDRVDIEARTGSAGDGAPTYGTAVEGVPGRLIKSTQVIRSVFGRDVAHSTMLRVRPDVTVAAEARITEGSDVYEVVQVSDAKQLRRLYHRDLLLSGPRPGA